MARFTTQPLKRTNPAGDELQQARQARHLTVKQAARRLNIPAIYIEALESGEWEALPQGDYGRYFLRQYAQFLELDAAVLVEQYPGPNLPQIIQPPKRAPINPTAAVHPLRRLLLVLIALAVVAYLAVAARAIFLPPQLEVVSPAADSTTSSPSVTVAGLTQPGTEVTVNNEAVEVMESGRFVVAISLRPGLNTLTVKARKSLSREVSVMRRVFYAPSSSTPSGQPELVP